jgi:protein-S-isoprenylcysteine O-methyltransferase Ste14
MKDLVMDWGERLVLVALFLLFAAVNLRAGDPIDTLIVVGEAATAYFVLTRRRAISITERPMDWLLAFAGTLMPLLSRPGGAPLIIAPVAVTLLMLGTLTALAAKLSLNRRFGIAPANRGVQDGWAYSLVRHPMYLGYIIAQIGYLLYNPSLRNLAVYGLAWACQFARIVCEERHLMQDAAYRDYASQVRRRLIPGVY